MSEPLMQLLADLPTTEPDAALAKRIKTACRAGLARQAPSAADSGVTPTPAWQPLVVALAVAYLIGTIVEALRVYPLS